MRQTAFFAFAVALLASVVTAVAQVGLPWPGPGTPHTAGGSFVGVIDQESTVNHFFGTVAGSQALATSNVNAVDLTNNTTTCTAIKVLSTGQLDINSGLYCNGGTQTVTAWCASNCVVGGSAHVSGLYDQLNPGTIKATNATYASQPTFLLSAFNSLPAWNCVGASSTQLAATITTIAAPNTVGVTFSRNAAKTTFQAYVGDNSNYAIFGSSTANTVLGQFFAGTTSSNSTATDASTTSDFTHGHAYLMSQPGGSTGNLVTFIDGSAATPVVMATSENIGASVLICGYTGDFASAFMTRVWTDPTLIGNTVGQAVTNLTTVPLP